MSRKESERTKLRGEESVREKERRIEAGRGGRNGRLRKKSLIERG